MAEKVEFELVAKTDGVVDGINKVDKAVKKTRVEVKKTNKELSGFAKGGKQVVGALDRVTGGLASKFVAVGKAAKLSGKAMRSALISSGIGIAIAAVGLLVEYWDDIKGLVDGVSAEQKELLKTAQDTVVASQERLDIINQSENILKLQGKTEKEILALKRAETDEAIAATIATIETQKNLKKTQIEAAERNQKITSGIVAFLNIPLAILMKAVDTVTLGLSKVSDVAATTFSEDFRKQVASYIFDPKKVEKKGDETIKATEKALLKLQDTRASYQVQENKRTENAGKSNKDKEEKAEKTKADALERIRKGLIDTEAEERAEKLRLIQQNFEEQIKLAEQYSGEESDKVKELRAAQQVAVLAQLKVFDDQNKATQKAKDAIEDEKTQKAQERTAKILASENAISISKKRFAAEEIQDEVLRLEKLKEIDALEAEQEAARLQLIVDNAEAGSEAKMNAEIALNEFLEEARQNNLTNQKNVSDASVEITDLENEAKRKSLEGYAGAISSLSSTIGQETAAGKGLAVASSLINTYAAITGQLKTAAASPGGAIPGYAIAQAIATGVAGFAAVKKIVAVQVPGGGGGSSQTGSMPTAPTPPAFNIVGASGETQLADAIGGQTQRPSRAYVVSNDVTTAQEMDRNIIEGASIG